MWATQVQVLFIPWVWWYDGVYIVQCVSSVYFAVDVIMGRTILIYVHFSYTKK